MKKKKWLKSTVFIVGGGLVGLVYYTFAGCASGTCTLTYSPWITMIYMGIVGWLLSGVFGKGCNEKCNT